MEQRWTVVNLCFGLLCCELCNGLPINSESAIADSHTQLLTGLVALLLTVCSVVFLAGCLCCQRKNGFQEFRDSPVVASAASNLDHGHVNPVANGEFTIFTPLSPPLQNNNVFLTNQQIITRTQEDYVFGDVDVSSWFNGTETDFPRIKLKYIKELGKGWFGRVVEGAAQDIEEEKKWTPVVVRILEATASSRERVVFLHDASIYRCGKHPNILNLLGRCLDTIPLLLLQEYCPQGDLKNYLLQNNPTADKLLSTEYPLVWCCQLSSALKHLHENKLTHPDLAARNCQLTSNLTLKLGDYGLAVFRYPEDYYLGSPGVSVRWCAPESVSVTSTTIQPKKVTLEANVWSFAVTMWEISACGERPYGDLSDDEVLSQVLGSQKVRLERTTNRVFYSDYIFRLMQLCWTGSESRPSMSQIDLMLGELLQVYKNTTSSQPESIKDFDVRWESFKPNSIVKTDNHVAELDLDDSQIVASKPLSPSLNNLHGSLDNLSENPDPQMESWLENVATRTGDMSYVRGLSDAIKDLDNVILLESDSPALNFRIGADDSKRTSSGSETEEENWKKKIERGAYTEKVRQKSRSVADLMVLTHIDASESESETPLPSLSYRSGSEGNLLNVQETFQDELRKLQEERRDSLLFVPENCSDFLLSASSSRILQELNSGSEIKPANQVFNVFSVTIDKISPVRLKEIIDLEGDEKVFEVPTLSEIITKKFGSAYTSSEMMYDSGVEGDRMESTESLLKVDINENTVADATYLLTGKTFQVPKLMDLIQDNDELMDYIIAKYETETLKRESLDSLETPPSGEVPSRCNIQATKEFLSEEIKSYDHKVAFDLSENQEQAKPNSLTHSSVFTSTPFRKKSLQDLSSQEFSSLNLFEGEVEEAASSNLFSLETWDNFLGKALDDQNDSQNHELFDSFMSEPQSLLFTESDILGGNVKREREGPPEETIGGVEGKEASFAVNVVDVEDVKVELEPKNDDNRSWDTNAGGWFLHPQSTDLSGEITMAPSTSGDTYVGFNMDDEIMAAIRTELLNKLPQAQGAANGTVEDDEDWESAERNEVFLRYNVYNTPLSPIPEESINEDSSCLNTPRDHDSDDENDSDWSDQCDPYIPPPDGESHSPHTQESSVHPEPIHRHTPSQDSCCSNDTLFNLEELTCVANELDREGESPVAKGDGSEVVSTEDRIEDSTPTPPNEPVATPEPLSECKIDVSETLTSDFVDKDLVTQFLNVERRHDRPANTPETGDSNSESTDRLLPFVTAQAAPLPSPEDNPWKQLPASLLTYDKVISQSVLLPTDEESVAKEPESVESSDFYNEADYEKIVSLENSKNTADFVGSKVISEIIEDVSGCESPDYANALVEDENGGRDIFGVLTDIRFSGPSDNQLMTTSFSESNDLNDEQDWDSGSDTRSSSSGEFIWKEGEHEESLKALRAAPQDVLDDIRPLEGIQEETSSESSGSDDDAESPEFVPSAWDKFATPTKSALRSPEKSEKKKSKGVWFKKQKYHCVYEYPREPESPILHSYDLWKPQSDYNSFNDWELDANEPYIPVEASDECDSSQSYYQPKIARNINMYQLSNVTDFTSSEAGTDDEFFISSSAKPFDVVSSQFFPGNWTDVKTGENATPDSGVEDMTPAGEHEFLSPGRQVKLLKQLAAEVVRKSKKGEETRNGDVLGGLRHTRDKLKLNLPPSPSAFTANRAFTIEPTAEEPMPSREKPTFTTFGKSRFLVQHVDTPPGDEMNHIKNVSFEALPYKPLHKHLIREDFEADKSKGNVEIVRGEASLLDSADEDSGIESSTLERKLSTAI